MAKMAEAQASVHLRINCIYPPLLSADNPLVFGLQDKGQNLLSGAAQGDGSLRFECDVQVKRNTDGTPNFLGAFAHGTAGDRFLYLTLKNAPDGDIMRRIKVKLASITWAQLEAAAQGGALEASVDGRGTASVPLLGGGWQVVQ